MGEVNVKLLWIHNISTFQDVDLLHNLLYNKFTTSRRSGVWAILWVTIVAEVAEIGDYSGRNRRVAYRPSRTSATVVAVFGDY